MTTIAPAITDITTDKPAYIRGETITVTVGYLPGQVDVDVKLTISGARGQVNGSLPLRSAINMTLDMAATTPDPATLAVGSVPPIDWALVSDDGSEAVYRGVWL